MWTSFVAEMCDADSRVILEYAGQTELRGSLTSLVIYSVHFRQQGPPVLTHPNKNTHAAYLMVYRYKGSAGFGPTSNAQPPYEGRLSCCRTHSVPRSSPGDSPMITTND